MAGAGKTSMGFPAVARLRWGGISPPPPRGNVLSIKLVHPFHIAISKENVITNTDVIFH